ncbi:heptaprenyl diphosphate synthase component 1 [Ferroacidibacillus organovorans]|uniref:Heptaprenyl diphosphate synthase n=2 Tax=Ferroacidibacillus organovorans TaxID=1765683 RepID=A0A1V4EUF2_9BACL|nr:heptaprenyl diphosphate synthase component 1 [Ferroacidibacillus organovorans]OAG94721.1 hypothetical protein AYW79_04045 [Ferroacidibacillus organovorans]OPG16566.1 hypothetical protein B2M26_06780 [Ferroacidibacillus organovorans]
MDNKISDHESTTLENRFGLHDLQRFVERVMSQAILKAESILPALSKWQLLLGAIILSRTTLTRGARDRVLASMILMYHGLALHEKIVDTTTRQDKKGQLTVLGGDYLSSLFYKLLAEANRIDIIHRFSDAVSKINVAKASLYTALNDGQLTDDQYISDVKTMHGALLRALCNAFELDRSMEEFVEAAISATVYKAELFDERDMESLSLAHVYLEQRATEEELKNIDYMVLGQMNKDKRITLLHAKYDTFTRIMQNFRDSMTALQHAANDVMGREDWDQLELVLDARIASISASAMEQS